MEKETYLSKLNESFETIVESQKNIEEILEEKIKALEFNAYKYQWKGEEDGEKEYAKLAKLKMIKNTISYIFHLYKNRDK